MVGTESIDPWCTSIYHSFEIIEVGEEPSPTDTLPVKYEPTDSVEQDSEVPVRLMHLILQTVKNQTHQANQKHQRTHQMSNQPWNMYWH